MELIQITQQMQQEIVNLNKIRSVLRDRARLKATKTSNYDKVLAQTIIKLRNGVEMEIDGEKVLSPQTTIMEKIAKGICWKEKLEMEEAEALYKSALTQLDTVKTIINAYQSISKYQAEITKFE